MIKPKRLVPGSRIAAVTPSWGGAAVMPWRYAYGRKQIEEKLGVRVVEMPNALRDAEWVYQHPKARADDLMQAFQDPSIHAIFATIGGDEAIRVLPHLDPEVIRRNPKIFLGFSDMTTIHFACYQAGLRTFYGPLVIPEFGEAGGVLDYTLESVKRTLFSAEPIGRIAPALEWAQQDYDWSPERQETKRALHPAPAWRVLQGQGRVSGHLLGGCFEVLEVLKGTDYWPAREAWNGAILFLETFDAPSIAYVEQWLRGFGIRGILQRVNGVLFGRPGGAKVRAEDFDAYDAAYRKVAREFGLRELPMLSRLDFGHSDPKFVLPYGARATIDCTEGSLAIDEAAVD